MTREEEDRRLALSTAIARVNAALDQIEGIDMSRMLPPVWGMIATARAQLDLAARVATRALEDMKQKAIDEEREATK